MIEPVDGAQVIQLEQDVPAASAAALESRGHKVKPGIAGFERSMFGRGQIILRDAGGHLTGGSDNRADGTVAST